MTQQLNEVVGIFEEWAKVAMPIHTQFPDNNTYFAGLWSMLNELIHVKCLAWSFGTT